MDEELTKCCPNCKRDIPSVNFTIHAVHCSRNIRVCPVCKEPVPLADLDKHHDDMHKQLPCKQCGESVCGTDLEDHLRDSCANTVKSCRYCELELPRRELPTHEGYCGVRTEQCPECREWVMIKYRQLHLDSNHGFLRLDDDPVPVTKKECSKKNLNRPLANRPSTSNGLFLPTFNNGRGNINENHDNRLSEAVGQASSRAGSLKATITEMNGAGAGGKLGNQSSTSRQISGSKMSSIKDTNKYQGDVKDKAVDKVNNLPMSRGAVKKRPAPHPPAPVPVPPADPRRDLPYYRALERYQTEERQRREQNAYNLSVGLPPVLSPAEKVEKLRKMDALQNREVLENDYKNRFRRNALTDVPVPSPGNLLGRATASFASTAGPSHAEAIPYHDLTTEDVKPFQNNPQPISTSAYPSKPPNKGLKNINLLGMTEEEVERTREEFKYLKPMTNEQFMERFNELQLMRDREEERNERSADRFSEIKSSLRELRRGLNEVTAPYNMNSGQTGGNNYNNYNARLSPAVAMDVCPGEEDTVRLPCEFCDEPVPMDDLVQHQTGCRPDLAQYRARGTSSPPPEESVLAHNAPDDSDPVIPCEFCAESLPIYLVFEHQKRCGRDSQQIALFYPD